MKSQSQSEVVLTIRSNSGRMRPKILESCHSTWVFDPENMRFRRQLKDVTVGGCPVTTQWRPYYRLVEGGDAFTVELNESGTRRITCAFHTEPCLEREVGAISQPAVKDNWLASISSAS